MRQLQTYFSRISYLLWSWAWESNGSILIFFFGLFSCWWNFLCNCYQIQVLPSLREKHDEFMLRELVKRWLNHKIMVRWLSRFFHYLDRYFIARRSLPALNEVGLTCFRDLVTYGYLLSYFFQNGILVYFCYIYTIAYLNSSLIHTMGHYVLGFLHYFFTSAWLLQVFYLFIYFNYYNKFSFRLYLILELCPCFRCT